MSNNSRKDIKASTYDIGKRIERFRKGKNLTQKELGKLLGIVTKQVWSYENNRLFPPIEVCIILCRMFDCSMDYLIFGTETESNKVIFNDGYDYGYKDGYNNACVDIVEAINHRGILAMFERRF